MGRVWTPQYVPGATRITCSICGFPRRFGDDDIVLSPDKLFRCEKCNEKTTYEVDQELAAFRQRREEQDIPIGLRPSWEAEQALLEIAQERQAALIPGWTPAATVNDTMSTLPGGVGSVWTVTGTGTVTAPSTGIARFSISSSATSVTATATGTTVPAPTAGRWYIISKIRVVTAADGVSSLATGSTHVSTVLSSGVRGASSSVFFWIGHNSSTKGQTSLEIDDEWHYAETWWSGDGIMRGAIDMGVAATVSSPGLASGNPVIRAAGTSSSQTQTIDVDGVVFFT